MTLPPPATISPGWATRNWMRPSRGAVSVLSEITVWMLSIAALAASAAASAFTTWALA
ncbi:hypothetical protein D3C72_2370820 [compost metagenome]